MPTEATKKLFTVDDYYKMAEAGVLSERVRTELLDGEIIEVSPMGVSHAAAITRVTGFFSNFFRAKAEVRVQLPLRLSARSELDPDFCLVKPCLDHYGTRHPGPADVLLVLEISDSSLRYDRDIKLPIYAGAAIPEVWIADLPKSALLVFREPSAKTYKTVLSLRGRDSVFPLAFPEAAFPVSSLIGPDTE